MKKIGYDFGATAMGHGQVVAAICGRCDGSGALLEEMDVGRGYETVETPCPPCRGTGSLRG